MVGHERRDEMITVVVSRLDPEGQRYAGLGACSFEQFGPQFLFDERIRIADIDEKIRQTGAVFDERNRIMETNDFKRAYEAFANKQRPVFEGN